MTELFDRKYNLTVGKPIDIQYDIDPFNPLEGGANNVLSNDTVADFRTVLQSDAILIEDLQMVTTINNSSNNAGPSSGLTTIQIYNLIGDHRVLVERVNNYIILEAGYEEDPELIMIFAGQVQSYSTKRVGLDKVTTLTCAEGYTPNNSIRISKTFEENDTYGDVIQYLANTYAQNGIPTGEIIDDWNEDAINDRTFSPLADNGKELIARGGKPQNYVQLPVILAKPANMKMVNGYSAVGYLHQVLENICKQIGYVSYITNGRLFVHPKGFTRMVEEYEFYQDQIKSINGMADNSTNSSIGKGIEGVTITTFIDGRLDIDKRVKVLDGEYAGSYKIITSSHQLDYERGSWDTTVTCALA